MIAQMLGEDTSINNILEFIINLFEMPVLFLSLLNA